MQYKWYKGYAPTQRNGRVYKKHVIVGQDTHTPTERERKRKRERKRDKKEEQKYSSNKLEREEGEAVVVKS